jgi:hypothetical protein
VLGGDISAPSGNTFPTRPCNVGNVPVARLFVALLADLAPENNEMRLVAIHAAGCYAALVFALALGQLGCQMKSGTYRYEQDVDRMVGYRQEGQILFGHLDADGNFTRDRNFSSIPDPAYRRGSAVSSCVTSERAEGKALAYTDSYVVINKPRIANEPVYEYRAGNLIKGNLDNEGNFIPELDSEVIPFTDYRYDWKALRIYNLPGEFVSKPPGLSQKALEEPVSAGQLSRGQLQ